MNERILPIFLSLLVYPLVIGQSLDDLIKQVFTRAPESSTPLNLSPKLNDDKPLTESCKCVPYFLCNNGSINKNGEGIIDIRMNDERPCTGYLDTCCDEPNVRSQPIGLSAPTQRDGCGYANPKGVGFKITGNTGHEAEFGEFPWMVALLKQKITSENKKIGVYQCGGALIHPQVVLTAAHCVKDKDIHKIRAGEWDTQTTSELYPHQDIEVESYAIHPQYVAGSLHYDAALLFLKKPVESAPHIGFVCLPPQDTVVDFATCIANGWGKDVFGKLGKYQVILKKIDLPMVPRQTCEQALRNTRLGNYFDLHKSFVCAGGVPGKDTCQGDGGSPLVCPIEGQEDRYVHVGMVAWGIGCGTTTPGVYVNVAMVRNWIDQQMSQRGLDTSGYTY